MLAAHKTTTPSTANALRQDVAADDNSLRAPHNPRLDQVGPSRDQRDSDVYHPQVSEDEATLSTRYHSQHIGERERQSDRRTTPPSFSYLSYPPEFSANGQTRAVQSPVPLNQESAASSSIPSAGRGSRQTAMQSADDGAPDGSYGTLVLSEGGRSRYLGPTAGSEWLKDVSHFLA